MANRSVLKILGVLFFLCVFVVKGFAFQAAAWHKWHSGGISRAIRRNTANSAATAEPPAAIKCQFGAALP